MEFFVLLSTADAGFLRGNSGQHLAYLMFHWNTGSEKQPEDDILGRGTMLCTAGEGTEEAGAGGGGRAVLMQMYSLGLFPGKPSRHPAIWIRASEFGTSSAGRARAQHSILLPLACVRLSFFIWLSATAADSTGVARDTVCLAAVNFQ